MQIPTEKIIPPKSIPPALRKRMGELLADTAKLYKEGTPYAPINVNAQVKAWKSEIRENPERAPELWDKIRDWPTKSMALRIAVREKLHRRKIEILQLILELAGPIRNALNECRAKALKEHEARCKSWHVESCSDYIVEAIDSRISQLDALEQSAENLIERKVNVAFRGIRAFTALGISKEFWK